VEPELSGLCPENAPEKYIGGQPLLRYILKKIEP
jgi:hypothetical protein